SIVEAFPELAGRVERSTRPSWVARVAYKMLERYLHRHQTGSHVEGQGPEQKRRPALWCLAELALDVGRPPHISFAFDAMYSVLANSDAAARYPECYREFISYSGSYDPYGLLGGLPPTRKLA